VSKHAAQNNYTPKGEVAITLHLLSYEQRTVHESTTNPVATEIPEHMSKQPFPRIVASCSDSAVVDKLCYWDTGPFRT